MAVALPPLPDAIGQPAEKHGDRRQRANSIVRSSDREEKGTTRAPAIHKCFHLGGGYSTGVPNIEKIRARKITKMKAVVRVEHGQNPEDHRGSTDAQSNTAGMNASADKASSTKEKKASTASLAKGDNMKNFCGISSPRSTHSISNTGSWFSTRFFFDTERLKEDSARGRPGVENEAGIAEGERFLLRRCKAILLRRHQTLNAALNRLEVEFARGLTLEEFTVASESFLKPSEARYIFRCLDAKHGRHRVSMEQLLNRLEELCLDEGGSSSLLT